MDNASKYRSAPLQVYLGRLAQREVPLRTVTLLCGPAPETIGSALGAAGKALVIGRLSPC